MSIRLQFNDWINIKSQFRLLSLTMSSKGHIRANLEHKKLKYKAHHWLNDRETETILSKPEELKKWIKIRGEK